MPKEPGQYKARWTAGFQQEFPWHEELGGALDLQASGSPFSSVPAWPTWRRRCVFGGLCAVLTLPQLP